MGGEVLGSQLSGDFRMVPEGLAPRALRLALSLPLELGFSSSLTSVVLLAQHWKTLDSYPYVDLQTLFQKRVVKIFSFNAFALIYQGLFKDMYRVRGPI